MLSAATIIFGLSSSAALGQNFPTRPVRFIVPFVPGGGLDITARAIAPKLSEALGKPVVVDNRPGAGGAIGLGLAARATPDGHTMVMASASHVVQAILAKADFDFFRDLAPVTEIVSSPYLLVVAPGFPPRSVKELIAQAKANPGKLNYASSGTGTLQQLSMELFKHTVGIQVVEVPYKGVGPSLIDLTAGRVQMMMSSLASLAPHVRAKTIIGLAIASRERSATLPELPTMAEAGVPGFIVEQWQGALVPSGTPRAVVERLQRDIARTLQAPEVATFFANDGARTVGSSPQQFRAKLDLERATWAKVVKQAGIKAE
jgi:tripartite-type tricarboxylate transporter receptor subunit TctC